MSDETDNLNQPEVDQPSPAGGKKPERYNTQYLVSNIQLERKRTRTAGMIIAGVLALVLVYLIFIRTPAPDLPPPPPEPTAEAPATPPPAHAVTTPPTPPPPAAAAPAKAAPAKP